VLDQISQQTRFIRKMSPRLAELTRDQIRRTLQRALLPLDAILGRASLPLSEVARLQVGDVIQLDSDVKEPVLVEVGGLPRFRARPGRRGEQSSVQVSGLIRDD
ncbi:MAG: FliM/FliN family flagellar motor switch protein, partial [Candidatus Hydrogenedentes bacterium]|nr:FliM/FliN family flagellar motor switch protein [Candidatus Hydrogenedentota bacterium]